MRRDYFQFLTVSYQASGRYAHPCPSYCGRGIAEPCCEEKRLITRKIENESHLESLLSEPTSEAIQAMRKLDGDLMLIGVGGKMGPSLARMARRASEAAGIKRRILGVSRFTDETCEAKIQSYDIETIRCDLLDDQQVARLPRVPNLIYMTGQKFGSVGDAARTWAMNTYVPSVVCRHFCFSRIVAFSTGNVYAFTSTDSQGSREEDVPEPVGEYGMSALGRERMFQYFSQVQQMPSAILRLNYACDLRYGVLVDLARKVHEEQPVDLGMGYFNTIWQGDANAIALQAFDHLRVPAWLVNMTGPERLSVREVCHTFARLMGKSVQFVGKEADTALLSCVERANCTLGRPRVGSETLMEWVADWVGSGGTHLGKPTHFEARDGRF